MMISFGSSSTRYNDDDTRYNDGDDDDDDDNDDNDDNDDDDDVSFPCNNIEFSHFHSVLFYQIQ